MSIFPCFVISISVTCVTVQALPPAIQSSALCRHSKRRRAYAQWHLRRNKLQLQKVRRGVLHVFGCWQMKYTLTSSSMLNLLSLTGSMTRRRLDVVVWLLL
ncbi:hypothetical protein BDR04DRAFT_50037 [Suillus decipiens]|nr:hypothetical protein BDR04DRAFT_50037 [Suillus decipiens]